MTNTSTSTAVLAPAPPSPGIALDEAANVAVVRRFIAEVVNHGRSESLAELVHDDYRYHGPDGQVSAGRAAAWQPVGELRAAFSDFRVEVTSVIAAGDRVALTLVATGTHDGHLMGMAPTSARIELPIAIVSRLEDQRIVEDWEYYDSATLINQLSIPVAPVAPAGTTQIVEEPTDEDA